jgi:TPR repeat protein
MSSHRLARILCLVCALAMSGFASNAIAGEDASFERALASDYGELLAGSKTAYRDKHYDDAAPLMKKAACAGDKESQWLFGHMYLAGTGVERNDLVGYSWLKVAAEFQSSEYRDTVDRIEQAIDPKQLPVAQAAARKYVDAYGLRATNMSCARTASRHGHILDQITCTPRSEGRVVLLRRCDGDASTSKAAADAATK